MPPSGVSAYKPVIAESPETVIPQWRAFLSDTADSEQTMPAVAFFAGKTKKPRLEFWALRVDLADPRVKIVISPGGERADGVPGVFSSEKVSSFTRRRGLAAGINALPFDKVSAKEGEDRRNAGIVISGGVLLSPPRPVYDALVFYPDGKAAIVSQARITTSEGIEHAAGGFRRILDSGAVSERTAGLTARHPRSAAGVSEDGELLYLLVIDGRRPGSVGSTEAETAAILKQLGAWDGINFDGGGSSTLDLRYPGGAVSPVNKPVHGGIPGRERAVAGSLGVEIR